MYEVYILNAKKDTYCSSDTGANPILSSDGLLAAAIEGKLR